VSVARRPTPTHVDGSYDGTSISECRREQYEPALYRTVYKDLHIYF
jgi:hypothetical protein